MPKGCVHTWYICLTRVKRSILLRMPTLVYVQCSDISDILKRYPALSKTVFPAYGRPGHVNVKFVLTGMSIT